MSDPDCKTRLLEAAVEAVVDLLPFIALALCLLLCVLVLLAGVRIEIHFEGHP